jgi:Zn finger protein HypA/HybF involved in hydrogenase expression
VPCPKCGGEIHENYKKFQCQKCDFSLWKIVASRQLEIPEVEELIAKRQVGPLQGFRSKLGRPFSAVIRLTPELKPEFDFGQDRLEANGAVAQVDFTGQEPLGKCPKCGARVFDMPMIYICEKAVGANRACDFRSGKIILQRPIERAQMQKLLETGKTDLLEKFISKKGRPFKAFLVVKDGKVSFEFEAREPRAPKAAAKTGEPAKPEPKIAFTSQKTLGKCPLCGKRVFEGGVAFVCEGSQADKKPCKFKINKVILQQPIDRDQAARLLSKGKTDLFHEFISSKTGRPFSAYLVMDETGKAGFDFPPRETETKPAPAK